jgi:glucose/arabinose dehydrogenase
LVLLEVFPTRNDSNQHNAGQLAFGPDGYLYLSIGDTTTPATAQDLSLLEGSILRIDVSNSTPEQPYAIPEDNPFVGVPGARPEIWAYGVRNPWRFTIDRLTGEMFAADVGSNGAISAEEVNLVVPGGNYGWPAREGTRVADCATFDCTGMIDPIWSYPRGLDPQVPCVAIVGGYVYHGSGLPGLDGAYLVTDLCLGYFWALRVQPGGGADIAQIGESPLGPGGINPDARISSLIEGPGGEPYVILNNGAELWKMVPAAQVAQPVPVGDDRPPTTVFAEDGVAQFFQRSCAACHGVEREGEIGPALLPSTLTASDDFYFETIANGREGTAMPSWRAQGLTDTQIAELVNWLKTSQP